MKQIIKIFLITILCLVLPLNFVHGDTLDRINSEIEKKKQLSRELEKKSKQYSNLAIQKKKEAETLSNQIEIMGSEILEMETNIQLTDNQLETLTLEISQLNNEITAKEAEISENKIYLSESIKKIYEYDNTDLFSVVLTKSTFSDFLSQIEYIENIQINLKSTIGSLKTKKQILENSKKQIEDKQAETIVLKDTQEYQKNVLGSQKKSKGNLLTATKGKEKEYKELLVKISEQKSELLGNLEELEKQKAEELSKAKSQQLNPLSGQASTSWYYKQNDSRWKNITIGYSRSTLGRYGCAVACVAMVATRNGTKITPGELAKKPIFYKDLIKWPSQLGNIELVLNKRRTAVDWSRVDQELSRGYPVIVFIRRTNGSGGHYVVVVGKDKTNGKYVVHDPYFGANIYLDSSRENLSILYGGCKTRVDQMIIYHKK